MLLHSFFAFRNFVVFIPASATTTTYQHLCSETLSKLDCQLVMFRFGQAIAEFLKFNMTLVDLDLSWNDIDDKEAEAWDGSPDQPLVSHWPTCVELG